MKRIYILKIVIFLTILILPIININLKPNQISEIDNKNLIELSDVLSGDFTTNTETFIEDRIGFRTTMINSYTKVMDFLFNHMVHPSYQNGKNGYIFSKLSRENVDYEYQEVYSDFILKVQNYCEDRNIDFLYAVEPSKLSIYPEYLPDGVNYQNLNLNYFLDLLNKKDINYVFTGDSLVKAKVDYQVFDKKFDANHWNETGAIVGISSILDKLNEINSSVDKFDINNYSIDTKVNKTLPVSYFPIEEETIIYNQNNTNIKIIDTYNDKIKISEQHRNFAHYINESKPDAPKILVFAGSYFNEKHKFLNESFSEFILVHNYENIFDIDYYINLFNPDMVLFESTEYTHNSNYFDINIMREITYNENLSIYSNLIKSEFTSIDNIFYINDNGSVTDFVFTLTNDETSSSYAIVENRVFDCKTITDDSGKQHIEFSIPSSEISDLSKITLYTISKDGKQYSEIEVNI